MVNKLNLDDVEGIKVGQWADLPVSISIIAKEILNDEKVRETIEEYNHNKAGWNQVTLLAPEEFTKLAS